MGVSTSGFYQRRRQPVTDAEFANAELTNTIVDIHQMSRRTYGSPRVHAELTLGMEMSVSLGKVERLMSEAAIVGVHSKKKGLTRRDPKATPHVDLVERAFDPDEPDLLWCMDITEHPTVEGKVYLAAVIDAFSRRIVGWSIADHMRSDIVVDALQMAAWRRQPEPGRTIGHSDHGAQAGFNWSSQHLDHGGVYGQASWMDDRVNGTVADEVAGGAAASSRDRARVLETDCDRDHERGCCGGSWRVASSRRSLVPPWWRDASYGSRPSNWPLPVISRTRRHRCVTSEGSRRAINCSADWSFAVDSVS
jgi:hypothetical protein